MPTENAKNLLAGLADLLEETEEAMVVRSTVRAALRSSLTSVLGGGNVAGGSSFTDIYESVNSTVFIDFNHHVYTERSGALNTLTPATVGGPVGTIADRTGTYIFRAPSDGARMTLRSLPNRMQYLEQSSGQYYVSDDAASTWKWLHDGTQYSVAAGYKTFNADDPDASIVLFGTYNSSGTQIGAFAAMDNRTVFGDFVWRYDISRGGGNFATAYRGKTIPLTNRRIPLRFFVDPNNATLANRVVGTFLGFDWRESGTASWTASTANPSATLHIGSLSGGVATGDSEIFGIVFYQGTWTDVEKATIDSFFDVADRDIYSITSAAANISNQLNSYEAFPLLLELANGNLLGAWRSASTHLSVDGIIRIMTSGNGGASWSDVTTLSEEGIDLRDPTGIVLPNGNVIIAAGQYDGTDSPQQDIYRSTNNGASFAKIGSVLPPSGYIGIRFYGPLRRLTNGTLLSSVILLDDDGTTQSSNIFESTDDGETWSLLSQIGTGLNETSIINLTGTTWLAIAREVTGSPGTVHYSTSTDDCATWTTPVDSAIEGVSPYLMRVDDSIYCLVGDRFGTGGVRALAWSNGKLWEVSTTHLPFIAAQANTDVGYPWTVVDGNSVSMLCFDESGSQSDPGIFFMKFDLPNFGSII